MKLDTGTPPAPGVYACRQWYGWRVLEWAGDRWTFQGRHATWPSEAKGCEIEMWAGPLPAGEYPQPAPAPKPLPIRNPPLEFDL